MMGDNLRDDTLIDLDLNQETLDPPAQFLGSGSALNELETAPGWIEERIRQLEAVTARARQRQRWRQVRNLPETSDLSIEPRINAGRSGVQIGNDSIGASERSKTCKRDSTHLVAKALEMDLDVKTVGKNGGSFFDCNICLNMAREPILTCCGHLFCWVCFSQLPYVDSTAKECPVCNEEVTDANIIPIYGNGSNARLSGSGLKVRPRPQAHRIESLRQQRVNRSISQFPVSAALGQIRTGIGAVREQPQLLDLDSNDASSNTTFQVLSTAEAGASRQLRSRQFSRVLSETAASHPSISPALSNTERLVVDLETYMHDRLLRRRSAQLLPVDGADRFTANVAVIQPESQTVDSMAEVNSTVSLPSSGSTDVSGTVVH